MPCWATRSRPPRPGGAHSACGQVGPRTSTAIIARAAAIVTNDSSPLHLALATRTPMVALFGPTVPSFGYGPLDPDAICLGEEELLCRPVRHASARRRAPSTITAA